MESSEQAEDPSVCKACKARSLVTSDAGEIVCSACGAVAGVTETEDLYSMFDSDKHETRMVSRSNLSSIEFDRGLYSYVSNTHRDAHGGRVDDITYRILHKTDVIVKQATNKCKLAEKTRRHILNICDKLNLSQSVREAIGEMHQKHYAKHIAKGRNYEVVMAVFAYMVCRERGIPKTERDFIDALQIQRKEFSRTYRTVMKILDKSTADLNVLSVPDVIPRTCSTLGLPHVIERAALDFYNNKLAGKSCVFGKHPASVAAVLIYIMAKTHGHNTTQWDVSRAAGITEVSLRNNYKKLQLAGVLEGLTFH